MEEIVDNKLLRTIENDRMNIIADSVSSLNDEDLKAIARQFGDAKSWDPLVREVASYIISYMYNIVEEYDGYESFYWDEPKDYDDYVDAYFHLVTRGREEYAGEPWFEAIKPNRIEWNVEEALTKFWEHIAKCYPEIESGDMSPEMELDMRNTMITVVEEWVVNNTIEKG